MESDRYVNCSGRLLLECKKCGEHLILLGLEDDWGSERTNFECGCGESLTLADRRNEEPSAIRKPLRANIEDPNDRDEPPNGGL